MCLDVLSGARVSVPTRGVSTKILYSHFYLHSPLSAHDWRYTPPVGTVAEAASTFLTHVKANAVPVSFLALLKWDVTGRFLVFII
jgi:hypothetical protein